MGVAQHAGIASGQNAKPGQRRLQPPGGEFLAAPAEHRVM